MFDEIERKYIVNILLKFTMNSFYFSKRANSEHQFDLLLILHDHLKFSDFCISIVTFSRIVAESHNSVTLSREISHVFKYI